MHAAPVIDVVSDANVVIKWFHTEGEEEVEPALALLEAHKARQVALSILDLTPYEVGNALLLGRAQASSDQVSVVLGALRQICPILSPNADQMQLAAEIAKRRNLTLYDAAYAAVALDRKATLVTLDAALLRANLGLRPSDRVTRLRDSAYPGLG